MSEAQEANAPGTAPDSDASMASAGIGDGNGDVNSWQPPADSAAADSGGVDWQLPPSDPTSDADAGPDSGSMAGWDNMPTAAPSEGDNDSSNMGNAGVMPEDFWASGGASAPEKAGLDEAVPVTEDTVATSADSGGEGTEVSSDQDSSALMPGVMSMDSTYSDSGAGTVSNDWAASAARYLDEAQRALDNLRRHLNSAPAGAGVSSGGAYAQSDLSVGAGASPQDDNSMDMATDMGSMEAGPSADMAGAGIYGTGVGEAESEYPSGGTGASGVYGAPDLSDMANIPMPTPSVEPAAEAGTLGASVDSDMDMGMGAAPTSTPSASTDTADTQEAPSPILGAEPVMARLVLIATGAEMPLPNQEEITVGREDPSSGIFPDVDLTPYGGEDGGVSRRHAKLLRIGDDFFVEDLQSTNYTKLDGQRLTAHTRERLEDGARVDFGRVATIFRRS